MNEKECEIVEGWLFGVRTHLAVHIGTHVHFEDAWQACFLI
jgi:hypothetical protein